MRHPYFNTFAHEQATEGRRANAVRAIVSNFKRGLLGATQAIEQLRRQGCFEAEINQLLEV